ncbi:MAG: GxxExxY protein [Bacteroidota bacterium]
MTDTNSITEKIIGCSIEVHKSLGPGLLESTYEECLFFELNQAGLRVERQKELPIQYKSIELRCGYRIDLLVEEQVIVELKSVDQIIPIHEAQILTYLKLSKKKVGLLINFNSRLLTKGIHRFVNNFTE